MHGELLEAERVHSIVGAFFAVYRYYGFGLNESVYAGALECELTGRGHRVVRELAVSVGYQGQHVAWQRLDMVVDDAVIVELKATEKLSPAAKPQVISYLRATRFEVAVLLHFGPTPKFYRFVDQLKPRGGSGLAVSLKEETSPKSVRTGPFADERSQNTGLNGAAAIGGVGESLLHGGGAGP